MGGEPPEGRRFQPGQSGNPLGGALHNADLKRLRRLGKAEVAEIGSLILEGNLERLKEIKDDPDASVIKTWFAALVVKSITKGDAHAFAIILDRVIGKPKEEIQHTVEDTTGKDLAHWSTEDLLEMKRLYEKNKPIEVDSEGEP